MNKGEGETKQGAKKMALFFIYPLSLISARKRTDRKQGDGVTKLVAKLYISPLSLPNSKKPILLFTDRYSTLPPLQEIAFPLFCVLKRLRKTTDKKR